MRFSWMGLSSLVVLGIFGTGCQNKLHDENIALWKQNRELQARLSDSDSRLRQSPDPTQFASMQQELAAKDQQLNDLRSQLQRPTPGATDQSGLEGIEVTRDDRAGTLTVNLPGDILFASGQADLKDSAKATLNKVIAAVRKSYPGKHVFVDGHTDSDPITRTKNKWEDNLDLSAARARTVAAYLKSQGLSSNLIGTRAFGPTSPKSGKAASRRVEIVVSTRDGSLAGTGHD